MRQQLDKDKQDRRQAPAQREADPQPGTDPRPGSRDAGGPSHGTPGHWVSTDRDIQDRYSGR